MHGKIVCILVLAVGVFLASIHSAESYITVTDKDEEKFIQRNLGEGKRLPSKRFEEMREKEARKFRKNQVKIDIFIKKRILPGQRN